MNTYLKIFSVLAFLISGYTLWEYTHIKARIIEILKDDPESISEITIQGFEKMRQKSAEEMRLAQQRKIKEKDKDIKDVTNVPFLGKEDADIVINEFLDFRCGHCRSSVDSIDAFIKKNPDVRVNLRFLPILGDESAKIAVYALLAHRSGKFKDFYKKMMASVFPDDVAALSILESLRVKTKTPEARKLQEESAQQIIKDTILAQDLDISATPSFVVGEDVIVGAQIDMLEKACAQQRKNKMDNIK